MAIGAAIPVLLPSRHDCPRLASDDGIVKRANVSLSINFDNMLPAAESRHKWSPISLKQEFGDDKSKVGAAPNRCFRLLVRSVDV
jgi:hypothetical protein